MKILPLILIATLTITLLLPQGCTKDVLVSSDDCEESEITTYEDVRFILNSSCGAGTTECHVTGGVFPDYTSYNDAMANTLTFNRFETRVLIRMDMPQEGWPQLDSLEFRKIKCWVQGGYQQ